MKFHLAFQDNMAVAHELSSVLHDNRKQIAEIFAISLESTSKWNSKLIEKRYQWDSFLQSEFFVFADYLANYFSTGDKLYIQLFIGEKIKSLYSPELDESARLAQIEIVSSSELSNLETLLKPSLSQSAWDLLVLELNNIKQILSPAKAKTQHILLVGDCLFLDIIPFTLGDLLEAGITLIPDYATSKNGPELRDNLRQILSKKKYDLIFYSPFTYEFSLEYTQLLNWQNSLMATSTIYKAVENIWSDTRTTLDLIADLSDSPIHVHNSSTIIREENPLKRFIKLNATARIRKKLRNHINSLLVKYINQKNSESFKHLYIIDESSLVKKAGEMQAGIYIYRSAIQHPAFLGQILAQSYIDAIYVNVNLFKKKVIVCDLDNTLWEGVIGEGPVVHLHNRQYLLKQLKDKGVVLAINSKNNPVNVNWNGATLTDNDFVYSAISWEPKVHGMKRIQSDLNLNMKDYVFIDDREDELNLMRVTFPEIHCLNATETNTWIRFAIWKDLLEDDLDMDRTLMYKQREQRKAFVIEDMSSEEEKSRLFKSLNLRLEITHAKPGDLKRVAELINRTNQFNLEGSRTTFKEVSSWHQSLNHMIIAGQTSDRFGDMGTTCIAVSQINGTDMELRAFVLSCRVFGYGIEQSIMNHLKEKAAQSGLHRIIGRYIPTSQNAPCKDFLGNNGFVEENGMWVYHIGITTSINAEWLDVIVE